MTTAQESKDWISALIQACHTLIDGDYEIKFGPSGESRQAGFTTRDQAIRDIALLLGRE